MPAVDTNALVRLVVLDDAAQHRAILTRLQYLMLELARDQAQLPLLTFDRKLLKTPGCAKP